MENHDQILDAPQAELKKLRYAGFGVRVGAYFIDAFVLTAAIAVVVLISGGLVEATGSTSSYALGIVAVLLVFLYFPIMESSSNQATLGKMAVGIKVGKAHGEQLSFANALGRYLGKIISGAILYIGYIMIAFDEKKQGLHDKIADTYVFYK